MTWLNVRPLLLGRRHHCLVYFFPFLFVAFSSGSGSHLQEICADPDALSSEGLQQRQYPMRNCLMQVGTKHVQPAVTEVFQKDVMAAIAADEAHRDLQLVGNDSSIKGSDETAGDGDSKDVKKTNGKKVRKNEKTTEKDEKEEGEAEGDAEAAARPMSWLLIASVVIVSLVFAMTHGSNKRLANYTTLAVENTLSIFIAVLWFQAFHTIIELFERHDHQVLLSIVTSLLWCLLMIVLTWFLRWRGVLLATLAQVGAHIVAFSSTHSSYILQKHYYSTHWAKCLYGLLVLLVFIIVLAFVLFVIKKVLFHDPSEESEDHSVNDWVENVDEIETDFFALAVAFAITEFVRFVIVGEFPQIQGSDVTSKHTAPQRFALLGWAILVTVVGGFIVLCLTQLQEHRRLGYLAKRVVSFISALVPGLIAWAFLDWGQWHVYEELDHLGSIFARVMFAILCTVIAILGVTFLAFYHSSHRFCKLGITAFSLMAAWSWEQAFDETFEESLKQWWSKLFIAAAVSLFVVPIMIGYIKPITMRIKEEMEEDAHMPSKVSAPLHNCVAAKAVDQSRVPATLPPSTMPLMLQGSEPSFTRPLTQDRIHRSAV